MVEFQYTSAFFYTKGILDEIFWASKRDATVYVYEDNGSVQGFIGLTKNYIEGIFVEESMRGKGIGTQLLNLAKQLCSSLTLQVYEKNQSALRFYFKEGFQIKKKQMDSETGQMDFTMEWSM